MAADQALLDLLGSAVFRIDVGGEVSGTGFAVAPGQIITCYHVIEPALKSPRGLEMVKVSHRRGWDEPQTPQADSVLRPDLDLALLRIPSTGEANAALLGENVQVDDAFYSYGFAADKPEGRPITFDVEGLQGGPPRLVMLKSGQVPHGMSGAPALNRRTGKVCGVIRRSRDVTSDLGGLATPMDVVLGAFTELRKDNRVATDRLNSRWLETMSPEQRTAHDRLTAGRGVGPGSDLVVHVGQDEDGWLISTILPSQEGSPDREESWGKSVRVDLNSLRTDVARLFRLLKATGRLKPVEQSKLFGQTLAKAIWSDEEQELLRERLENKETRLHISLHFDDDVDEDLRFLSWEQMTLPKVGPKQITRLGARSNVTFSRVLDPVPGESGPGGGSLQVLLVNSPGNDGDAQSIAKLTSDVASDIAEVTTRPPLRLPSEEFPSSTPLALQQLLDAHRREPDAAGQRLDVMHYLGYGQYVHEVDEIQLDGAPDDTFAWLDAQDLAAYLAPQAPRLVILQPLKSIGRENEVPVDFTALAAPLLQAGVDAVLAFPLPVDHEAAKAFFKEFYRHLGDGDSVRSAVQEGRVILERGWRPWTFPALLSCRPTDLYLSAGRPVLSSGAPTLSGVTPTVISGPPNLVTAPRR